MVAYSTAPYLMTNQELLDEVLREVNMVRAHFNAGPLDRMPHGDRHSCPTCPLALALDCGFLRVEVWYDDYIRARGHGARVRLARALGTYTKREKMRNWYARSRELVSTTSAMREFIMRFDRGDIPELDEAAAAREPALAA